MLRQNSLETASAKEAAQIAEYERDNEVKKVDPYPYPYPNHYPDLRPKSLSLIVIIYLREIGELLAYDTSYC